MNQKIYGTGCSGAQPGNHGFEITAPMKDLTYQFSDLKRALKGHARSQL
jgi:hypothetical protein